MTTWKNVLGGAAAAGGLLLSVFIVVVALQPDEFKVTRSAKMAAPAARVFEQVNDYHKWEAWSPWAKLDSNAKTTFEGPDSGSGAKFSWSGNDKVGSGTQTIIESKPDELIRIRLEFEKPMKATNEAQFTFQPQSNETLVTWTMTGQSDFIGKAFCLICNMDKMVGSDFEKGLANLKAIVEKPVEAAPATAAEEKKATEN